MKPVEPKDKRGEDVWASYLWHLMKKRANSFCGEQYMVHAWPTYMNRLVDDVVRNAVHNMSDNSTNNEPIVG